MKEINIGSKIASKRKEKGLTQEDLADFLCVSKPAVSKWESGQSYPDITLLPVLASYFNVSVDELLGYEPQMTKENIKKLYIKLCNAFATEPFEKVYAECNEYAKKYFSCWNLQFHIGLLFLNHVNLAGNQERVENTLSNAVEIFERIDHECDDVNLANESICLQAYCYLAENKPALAIDLLDDLVDPQISVEVLLAKAYQMNGNNKKAISLLQGQIYQNVMGIISACSDYMLLFLDNPQKAKECSQKIIDMTNIFGVDKLNPSALLTVFLTAAYTFMMQGNKDEALDMLEKYIETSTGPNLFPIKLHGNDFFDSLDDFFNSLDLGTGAPRSEDLIMQSIKDSVIKNPAFDVLKSESRYIHLVKKLEQLN